MKKFILTIFFVLTTIYCQSQIALGYSFNDVKTMMTTAGHILDEGVTEKDNIRYITAYGSELMRLYFFTENNVCFLYVYAVKNSTYRDHEQVILKEGYRVVKDGYVNDQYFVRIFYNDKLGLWCTSFVYK